MLELETLRVVCIYQRGSIDIWKRQGGGLTVNLSGVEFGSQVDVLICDFHLELFGPKLVTYVVFTLTFGLTMSWHSHEG